MRFVLIFAVALSTLVAPVAFAATKAVKPAAINFADVTGPKLDSVQVDKTAINLKK